MSSYSIICSLWSLASRAIGSPGIQGYHMGVKKSPAYVLPLDSAHLGSACRLIWLAKVFRASVDSLGDTIFYFIFLLFHLTNFVFKNETQDVILHYFIFPPTHNYKFISFSHVKLICDSLKLAKWCIVCYEVVCNNFPIREKSSLSVSFCVWPNCKCLSDESTWRKTWHSLKMIYRFSSIAVNS